MTDRNAGILLHISSLPSSFGIGDLGPSAYAFIDFLSRSLQQIWQILPLNPVDGGQNFSPYSSVSSCAGNILLISPEILMQDALLTEPDIQRYHLPGEARIDFAKVEKNKTEIFELAWKRAQQQNRINSDEFIHFCNDQALWLEDFALYSVIKIDQQKKPWFQWPSELKKRNADALNHVKKTRADSISKIKFLQFLFEKQWQSLKKYAADKGVQILGDLSFYVSHDSVDVWSNPEIFKIDVEGNLIAVAGTPPDLFSNDGQLWNMPIYNWKLLQQTGYPWWINRIKRNAQLFHMLRLDHFRGFAGFWEVRANEQTAKNGSWKKGPGSQFFKTILSAIPNFPLIAEDLGEITEDVIKLRERFGFPGMKVLQFAFGDNMSLSEHIPHNYSKNFFVFTGTHDNNTSRGWFTDELDDNGRNRLQEYTGKQISADDAATQLIHLAYASVASTAIIPMQDILNLDGSARMNKPGVKENNWSWRLESQLLNLEIEDKLKKWATLFRRNF